MIHGAVLGSPISHSLSPLLHKNAYEYLGIDATYEAFDVKSGSLDSFLAEHVELDCLSLTMPLKEEAIAIADSVTSIAQQISSGNTLRKKDGKWELTTTDVEGFVFSTLQHKVSIEGSVLVIGGGATARAVVGGCNGISEVIHVISRNRDRESLIRAAAPSSQIIFHPWQTNALINSTDLIVNTTPKSVADIFIDSVKKPVGVYFEILYNPWPTHLLHDWREKGGSSIDGLDLLIHQGISQIELFSGKDIDRVVLANFLRLKALEVLGESTTR